MHYKWLYIPKWHYWWSRGRVKLIDECSCTVKMYMPVNIYWGHMSPLNTNATFVDNAESILPRRISPLPEHIATKFKRPPHIFQVNLTIGAAVYRGFRHSGISVKDGFGRFCRVRNLVKPRVVIAGSLWRNTVCKWINLESRIMLA